MSEFTVFTDQMLDHNLKAVSIKRHKLRSISPRECVAPAEHLSEVEGGVQCLLFKLYID